MNFEGVVDGAEVGGGEYAAAGRIGASGLPVGRRTAEAVLRDGVEGDEERSTPGVTWSQRWTPERLEQLEKAAKKTAVLTDDVAYLIQEQTPEAAMQDIQMDLDSERRYKEFKRQKKEEEKRLSRQEEEFRRRLQEEEEEAGRRPPGQVLEVPAAALMRLPPLPANLLASFLHFFTTLFPSLIPSLTFLSQFSSTTDRQPFTTSELMDSDEKQSAEEVAEKSVI